MQKKRDISDTRRTSTLWQVSTAASMKLSRPQEVQEPSALKHSRTCCRLRSSKISSASKNTQSTGS
ncbi:hypothetical protein FOXG_04880 [Fusarium oxysporum f. sp. lycopersici 4287]|uniref:Uncharacterized protein n=2 Tax=Fusarium oxysporum TaxID=5507 RepID=A0A0J9URZ5_FUSO4|nr:hypothetical protein FOXG_04880 [Fusarium oxysporum f. sp. lycopersici 4287]EXK38627.1 hypothetical protein FOMG_06191 [Fusarium oxysporum f. sp. melonis 26406]KNB01688.1 hypothetical protein FOXG_04880 [Fusarium oxysporum f. sp. lycopersici 4287]